MQKTHKPWYRQWTPWLLLLGPIVVIVAGIYTVYLAMQSNNALVVDDYYKEGKAINQVLIRDKEAVSAGLQASVLLGQDRKTLRVLLMHRSDYSVGEKLTLRLQHPTRAEADLVLPLTQSAPRVYETASPRTIAGRWYISLEQARWRLIGEWDTVKTDSLNLKPGSGQPHQKPR